MIEKRNEAIKDWEAIRALGICFNDGMGCGGCPVFDKYSMDTEECRFSMAMDVIDLINRQKAEIEELQRKNSELEKANESFSCMGMLYSEIKSEARKEFAERLKKKTYPFPCAIGVENAVTIRGINDLLAEMEGDGE